MTQEETTQQPEQPVQTKVGKGVEVEEKSVDRLLEGSKRFTHFDLLEQRGTVDMTTDPDVKRYFEAKKMFLKSYELCKSIPSSLESDVLEKYEEDIRTAAETMVAAWLMDDRTAPISERVLILGQQYEKVLLKDIPEEEHEGFFVKYSLLFSAWILLVGKQFDHCVTTLDLAINTYGDELPARVYVLRASCCLNLQNVEGAIENLKTCLEKDNNAFFVFHNLGSIYMSTGNREEAIKNFELYLEKGHPDTVEIINSLYSLSVLYSDDKIKSKELYQKALKAEKRFNELYGAETGLNDVKRHAIKLHESPEEARMKRLIQSGILDQPRLPPSRTQCYTCQESNRKDDPTKPLMCCGGCGTVWYCSRDCQKKDYRAHKNECQKKDVRKEVVQAAA